MKRTLFVIVMLLCVALFALPALAEDCEHWAAWCDGKCIDCGTADVNVDEIWHKYEKYEYYDETGHWAICTLCGQKDTDLWEHNALCNGTCADCGATGLAANPDNHDYKPVYYDETFHWDTCTICGATSEEPSNHSVSCMASDTSICEGCGSAASDTWISHVDDMIDDHDATHHWSYWPTCGMTGTKEEHYVNCSNPGVCDSCGRSGLDLPVNHTGTRMTGSNETEHWEYCGSCDAEYADTRAAHTVLCTNPGVCTVCGAADCTNTAEHVGSTDGQWQYDDNGHWLLCACGVKINEGTHAEGTLSGDEYEHWYICACGAEYGRGWHEQYCDAMGTCIHCGITTLPEDAEVRHKELPDYAYDAQGHWYPCESCDTKNIEGGPHRIDCTTNACITCGYNGADIVGDIEHQGNISDTWEIDVYSHWRTCDACNGRVDEDEHYSESGNYQTSNTYCWLICDECDNQFNVQEHHVICPDNGKCSNCGMEYAGEVEHWIDSEPEYFHDNDQHWYFCDADCGTQLGLDFHDISCKDSTVCLTCGATGLTGQSAPPHTRGTYEKNDTECWVNCTVCGEEIERQKHEGFCAEGYACRFCGTTTGTIKIYHEDDDTYFGDETKHWQKCMHCSEIFYEREHTVYCTKPGVCADCYKEGCTNEPVHTGEIEVVYNETHHWEEYSCCGEIGWEGGEHYNVCISGLPVGRCVECAYDQVTTFYHIHDGGTPGEPPETTTKYSETEHWEECNGCNTELADTRVSHTVTCANPGVCTECGATGCTNEASHLALGEYQYDESSHWRVCTDCGNTFTDMHLVTDNFLYDATHCWIECTECGIELSKFMHEAACNTPGYCNRCGADWDGEGQHMPLEDSLTHNETHCWYLCAYCGEEIEKSKHFVYCDNPNACDRCGATVGDDAVVQHDFNYDTRVYDDTYCWVECRNENCDEITNKWRHSVTCTSPDTCIDCGASYSGGEAGHDWENSTIHSNAEEHWYVCNACGEAWNYGSHYALCINPGKCDICGIEYNGEVEHYTNSDTAYEGDDKYHWCNCAGCGVKLEADEHRSSCENPGVCVQCGMEVGDDVEVMHYRYADTPYEYDETHHWFICIECNEPALKREHKFTETERDESKVVYTCGCGATKEEILHTECIFVESSRVEASCGVAGKIVYSCECGEIKTEEIPALTHKYATAETPATCEEDGKKVMTCANCGDEKTEVIPAIGHKYDTVETPATCWKEGKKVTTCANCGEKTTEVLPITKHVYKTIANTAAKCTVDGERVIQCTGCGKEIASVIPATGHKYELVSDTAPTCESEGETLSVCSACGFELAEISPATGHAYGSYTAQGDGTHVAECAVCGNERQRDCSYQNVTTNGITLTVCTVCGYTRFAHIDIAPVADLTPDAAKAPAEEADSVTPDTLFVPEKVENIIVKSVKGEQEEALPAGVQLVVYDQSAMLQEDSPILALYTIGLESDGYARDSEAILHIELPLAENQTAADFAQYKLVVIHADGTLTEIEYVIEEGKIIFETNMVGVFAFLPIEE